MQTNTGSVTQRSGQHSNGFGASGLWPSLLEELDLERTIDLGKPRDVIYLRRALETESSVRRFGAGSAASTSIFDVIPCAKAGALGRSGTQHRPRGYTGKDRVCSDEESSERRMLGQSVEQAQLAVVMLDGTGDVMQMTPAARALLAEADGIAQRGKRLLATTSAEQAAFRALLAEASHVKNGDAGAERSDEGEASTGEGAMLLTRHAPRRPLQIVVTPLRGTEMPAEMEGAVLVYLCDPAAAPLSRAPILRRLYGLSPTEGRLVDQLAAGVELQEAANHLRLTVHTARFHLKSIFRKTSVNRQTDLIRLVLSLPGATV